MTGRELELELGAGPKLGLGLGLGAGVGLELDLGMGVRLGLVAGPELRARPELGLDRGWELERRLDGEGGLRQ